jgi:hypothetical protein
MTVRMSLPLLCYIGDLAHHPVLLLEKPLTEFLYDTDAYHFAWPGIGHVAKQGDGFRYYPEGMTLIPT